MYTEYLNLTPNGNFEFSNRPIKVNPNKLVYKYFAKNKIIICYYNNLEEKPMVMEYIQSIAQPIQEENDV